MPKHSQATILSVVGARPQFIKAAVVSRVLRAAKGVREVLVHTGQHYDPGMSGRFFEELDIPDPDHNLGVGSGSHAIQTAGMLTGLEQLMQQERPDVVLLYGDTNSTLAGALAAAKLNLPIAHVEAGLRSFNRAMPEEVNRIVADHLSDLLLAPTETARQQLLREGVEPGSILLSGDVMYDAALFYAKRAADRSEVMGRLGLAAGGYVLVTVHRAENTDHPERLAVVVEGLRQVAADRPVVWPVHPRTRGALQRLGVQVETIPGLLAIEPVGYLDMIRLEQHAAVVVTDSGGVQKEAFFHRVPCVTLRTETEWTELVQAGCNRLCPPRSADEVAAAIRASVGVAVAAAGLYGAGDAGDIIVEELLRRYGGGHGGDPAAATP
jgi:UDP-GlcNAc3NAcA epimerase